MRSIRRQSLIEQTAEHLRLFLREEAMQEKFPGVLKLATTLRVSADTVRAALKLLEADGTLLKSGPGRPRRIQTAPQAATTPQELKIGFLLNEALATDNAHSQSLILGIQHQLTSAGHQVSILPQSLQEMKYNLKRIQARVAAEQADAWLVYGGSRTVLEWFAKQKWPTYALGGQFTGLPIGGSRAMVETGLREAVGHLAEHGHRRIVLICPQNWRQPSYGASARGFLESLAHCGLEATGYNIPDWEETPQGLRQLLEQLFFATPPTALILVEPVYTTGVISFLADRHLRVPADVSLLSLLPDPVLAWHQPKLAHLIWPMVDHLKHVEAWARKLARRGPRVNPHQAGFPTKLKLEESLTC